jgi:hypothetical protein
MFFEMMFVEPSCELRYDLSPYYRPCLALHVKTDMRVNQCVSEYDLHPVNSEWMLGEAPPV